MNATFIHVVQGEWLKLRRSFITWLVVAGAFFTPAIVVVARLVHHERLPALYASADFWSATWKNSWESMALFFLPMCAILVASLVTQIEFRNNAWKQVHALPIGLATIYFSKFLVVLLTLFGFVALFNLGIYASVVMPWLLVSAVPYPPAPLPFALFLRESGLYFIDCLPIVALQYAMCLRFRNFLPPVGLGFLAWVGAIGSLPWKYAYVIPYTYTSFNYLKTDSTGKASIPPTHFHWFAIGYFIAITAAGYWLFARRRDKG